ncbi:hypothetical protein [Undibacterium sp. RuTC16W]|uniref:hypothetical protein n=1 Tax=Undibacterium sp. RuTC16W TaxID=3413048 RepID=UPI003BF14342
MKTWKVKSSKKIAATCMSALIASSLVVPSAHAYDEPQFALSGIWTQAKLLKEYIDWRSSAGWGTMGAANILITKMSGGTDGQMTKAVFSAICGTAASGLMANWKPLSEPTAASHFKAIVKSASIVGASSTCGWVSQFAFNKINQEIPNAQKYLNQNASQREKSDVANDAADANSHLLEMEAAFKALSQTRASIDFYGNKMNANNCTNIANINSFVCTDSKRLQNEARANFDTLMAKINFSGSKLWGDLSGINAEIHS